MYEDYDDDQRKGAIAPRSTTTEMATTRQAQEVQAAMVVAKKFPRDITASIERIRQSCRRPKLAEGAMYEYKRGGNLITGPSIRLAEEIARQWGNLDCGIIELETKIGESTMMAYAWDLETNMRKTNVFNVKHERSKRDGNVALTDPRDVYENNANQAARRLRSVILQVIPVDVQEIAVEECEKTINGANKEPIADRARKMLGAFEDLDVTKDMIEARLGHKIDGITERQLLHLRKVYTSLKDGIGKISDFFGAAGGDDEKPVSVPTGKQKVRSKAETKPPVDEDVVDVEAEPAPSDEQVLEAFRSYARTLASENGTAAEEEEAKLCAFKVGDKNVKAPSLGYFAEKGKVDLLRERAVALSADPRFEL